MFNRNLMEEFYRPMIYVETKIRGKTFDMTYMWHDCPGPW